MIRCDQCRRRPASVHVTRIVNGDKSEQNLCEQCAEENGELPFTWEANPAEQFLAGFLQQQTGPRCPTCGTDYAEFARTSLLGCPNCYNTFAQELEPLLRRVQGSGRHRGKVPQPEGKAQQVEQLRAELADAVKREDYEQAAVLRDRLRALEA